LRLTIPENLKPPHKRAGAAGGTDAQASSQPVARPRKRGRKNQIPEDSRALAPSQLAKRRDELAQQFVELQWDLGGVAYEMARRDHFRLDVLVRRAAKLQEVDAALAEAERMLRLEQAGAAGTCPACGALHARGAVFCWQCGNNLMGQAAPGAAAPARPAPAAPPPPASPAPVEALPPAG